MGFGSDFSVTTEMTSLSLDRSPSGVTATTYILYSVLSVRFLMTQRFKATSSSRRYLPLTSDNVTMYVTFRYSCSIVVSHSTSIFLDVIARTVTFTTGDGIGPVIQKRFFLINLLISIKNRHHIEYIKMYNQFNNVRETKLTPQGFFYRSVKNEDSLHVVGLFIKIVFKVIIKISFHFKGGIPFIY